VVEELRQAEIDNDKPARPIILAGDFNAVPSSQAMLDLRAAFTLLEVENPEAARWTHTGHKILIDHVLVSDPRGVLPEARCFIQTDVPFDDLTDHLPVVAIFGE
jgi:endonuclease/exonuclease/phosphatase (EEP) superfamily protein YafD